MGRFSDGVFEDVFSSECHRYFSSALPKDYNWPVEVFSGVILTYGSLKKFFFFFVTLKKPTSQLGVEPRPSTIASKHNTTELYPQTFFKFGDRTSLN